MPPDILDSMPQPQPDTDESDVGHAISQFSKQPQNMGMPIGDYGVSGVPQGVDIVGSPYFPTWIRKVVKKAIQ